MAVLLRMLWAVAMVCGKIRRAECVTLESGAKLRLCEEQTTPFSWFGNIVISRSDFEQDAELILRHEQAHIKLRHSWDILFMDAMSCMQWFNPAMWLLRRELQAIHEFEADDAVLQSGVDAQEYQLLLVRKAVGQRFYSIANCLNHSKLKNRIAMMLQKKSSRWATAKALFILPLTCIALGAFARTTYVISTDDKGTNEIENLQIFDTPTTSIEVVNPSQQEATSQPQPTTTTTVSYEELTPTNAKAKPRTTNTIHTTTHNKNS